MTIDAGRHSLSTPGMNFWHGTGFQAFMISGDYTQQVMHMAKAQRLLGWAPLARPRLET